MKAMLKDAAILFAITVVAGILLGTVYGITKEPIEYQAELAVTNACREVFAEASEFDYTEDFEYEDSEYITYDEFPSVEVQDCMNAYNENGDHLGYIIQMNSKQGYGGDITLIMGVQDDGTLNGVSILSISETAGLGMEAPEVLVPQFAGKKVTSFLYTKNGAVEENEIDAISGATITTNAVVNAVNVGMYYFYNGIGR